MAHAIVPALFGFCNRMTKQPAVYRGMVSCAEAHGQGSGVGLRRLAAAGEAPKRGEFAPFRLHGFLVFQRLSCRPTGQNCPAMLLRNAVVCGQPFS